MNNEEIVKFLQEKTISDFVFLNKAINEININRKIELIRGCRG